MQTCDDRAASLVDAAAGELSDSARTELAGHFETCVACRTELAELREIQTALEATSRAPDDLHLTGFAFRVTDRAEMFRDRSPRGLWWSLTRGARLAMTFSMGSLVASLAFFFAARSHLPHRPMAGPIRPAVSQTAAPHAVTPAAQAQAAVDPPDAWEEDIPQAITAIHDEGPVVNEPMDDAVSLDLGMESLSADELAALDQALDQSG